MSSAGMWTFSTLYAPRVRFDGACGSVWHAWVMCGRRIYVGREKLRFTRRNVRPRVTRLRACTTEGFCIFASFVLACTSVVDGPTYASVLCVTRTHGLHVYAPRCSVFIVTIKSPNHGGPSHQIQSSRAVSHKILLWLGASLQCRRDFVRPESIPCAPV